MGLLFANPAPPRQSERQTGFAPCQRFKSPKAASNLQFERPWDRLVPAKSARKLTAPMVVSKKFWLAARADGNAMRAVEGAVLSASEAATRKGKSAEQPTLHHPRLSGSCC